MYFPISNINNGVIDRTIRIMRIAKVMRQFVSQIRRKYLGRLLMDRRLLFKIANASIFNSNVCLLNGKLCNEAHNVKIKHIY